MNRKITLPQAFNLGGKKELIAFTGGGGKSSLMVALAAQLPGRVLVTSTTRMFADQISAAAASLPAAVHIYPDLPVLDDGQESSKFILISSALNGDKVYGIALDVPGQLLNDYDFVLVEADGSRMLPIKAPAAHEPAIPPGATLVVPILGIDSLNQTILETAHRPQLLAGLLAKTVNDRVTIEDIVQVLVDQHGGLKNVPEGARVIPAINKVETKERLQAARRIARQVLSAPRIEQVVISQAQSQEPVREVHKRVCGVILAAGQSKRMGQSKQLMPWAGSTVLGQTIDNVKKSAVHDLLVVSGHEAGAVEKIAADAGTRTVFNPCYTQAEMLSSLQVAVKHLDAQIAAVLVMLADQPLIEPETINRLLHAYWQGQGTIIAPHYEGRRGNPVLIDRYHFAALLDLPPGCAPRDLLKQHDVTLVAVNSPSVLQDIDNPQDYERFKP